MLKGTAYACFIIRGPFHFIVCRIEFVEIDLKFLTIG